MMKPGDLVILSNKGSNIRVIPDIYPRPLEAVLEYPSGTVVLLLEVNVENELDGPTMSSYARILVDGKVGVVWLFECQELRN
jgi:hypothetical protein